MWNECHYRAQVERYLKVHGEWIAWCWELDRGWKRVWDMQNELGKRQAIVEQRLEKLGFVTWTILSTRMRM